MGDPSGVGPEVALAAYKALSGKIGAHPLKLVGDADVFRAQGEFPGDALIATTRAASHEPGRTDPTNAPAILAAIEESVRAAEDGRAAAIVTAPIHKASLLKSGFRFPGHTEYLAHLTGAPRAVMMLVGAGLRVVPLTIHIPYTAVPAQITKDAIVETGRIVLDALDMDFGITQATPRRRRA